MSAWPAPSASTKVAVTAPPSSPRRTAGPVALLDPPVGRPLPPPTPGGDDVPHPATIVPPMPPPDSVRCAPSATVPLVAPIAFAPPSTTPVAADGIDDTADGIDDTADGIGLEGIGLVRSPLVQTARFLALFWCWTILWLALWSIAPAAVGWTPTVVTSGSMEPSVGVGSIVHVDDKVDLDSIGPGAIVTFQDPALPDLRVTHRITKIETTDGAVTGFTTKGDANESPDSTIVPVENIEGVARLMVPYAGVPKVWAENGNWVHLGLFVVFTAGASALAIDTIIGFLSGRNVRGRRRRKRQAAATAVAISVMLGAPSSSAAFDATTDSLGNSFDMTGQWHLDAIDRESPVAHWRLGEPAGGGGMTVFTDDFESPSGYTQLGVGRFRASRAQARSGDRSGRKYSFNDPNGGWRSLPTTVTDSFVFEVWVYRPSAWGGGPIDRLGLEDAAFNGYTFNSNHSSNTLNIDRRTAGVPTAIGTTVAFDPPEDAWYRLELVRTGAEMTLTAYDGGGTVLATASATDATTTTFDRLVVRGGHEYFVDDVTVVQLYSPTVAVDRIGTLDGSYVGGPAAGVTGLVAGDPDTAVEFDGINDAALIGDAAAINTTTRAERSVELWFQTDTTTGRQVIYEEGGTLNGMVIYLDGPTLYARAWSEATLWSNALTTSTAVAAGTRYHVAVTLDAVTARQLTLYVDGAPVSSATKTDGGLWSAHTDDGAIGYANGGTEFHDGDAGAGYHFDGKIDEVVLFNSVLAPATVANHYDAGK